MTGVTNYTILRQSSKSRGIFVTPRAIQGNYSVIDLVLYQTEVSPCVIKLHPGSRPGVKLATLVFRVTAKTLVNLIDAGMHTFLF